jgi:hypothetical protein
MDVRKQRACRPRLERVERRDLPSGLIASMVASHPPVSAAAMLDRRVAAAAVSAANVGASGTTVEQGQSRFPLGNGFTGNTNSPLLGAGTPTPYELKRETFKAQFSGPVYTGPGRFSDQLTTYYFRGIGGSSWFLHGDYNMAVVVPTDNTAPFIGEAVLQDKNNNSSAVVGFILQGNRTDVDSQGRPTKLELTADPNIYSGVFYSNAAEGTVTITYGPKNTAHVAIDARVYTSGLTSPLVNSDLYARHGRPLRNRF